MAKNGPKWPKSQLCDVKMTSKSLFSKKIFCQKFKINIFLWDRLYDFFALLPGLKLQKLLIFTISLYSLYKIPTICQISVFWIPAHVPPPFDKIFNGLSCTLGCPLTC